MSRSIRIRPDEERDVESLFNWYEEQASGLEKSQVMPIESLRVGQTPGP